MSPDDETAFRNWYRAWSVALGDGRTDPPLWTIEELRVQYLDDDPARALDREAYAAVADGEVLGTGVLELPRRDNPRFAEVEVTVPPRYRRRGVGTALFAAVLDRATELGRDSLAAAVAQPVDAPRVPGVDFAGAMGFTWRNTDMRRRLDLPVDPAVLDALERESAPHHVGYRLVSWRDRCPDQYAAGYADLKSRLMTDAPTGTLEYEPEVWDVARLRAEEELTARQDRTVLTTVALDGTGDPVGHTQLAVPHHGTGEVFQWDTLVLPEHRGHRLGVALKVANQRVLASEFPDRRCIETWNAVQNGPMNAVNEALGFRSLEELQSWQRDPGPSAQPW